MKVNKIDEDEIKSAISSLKLQSFRGCSNKCFKCNKKGYFGSICRYKCESGNIYMLCAWCGSIIPLKK